MPRDNSLIGAHFSFPLTSPALQSASIKPDFLYLDINHARTLSASLGWSSPAFSAAELSAIGLLGKIYLFITQQQLNSNQINLNEFDEYIQNQLGREEAQTTLFNVLDVFPTTLTYLDPQQKESYAFNNPNALFSRHAYYLSLILIFIADHNPAIRSRDGVFTDPQLRTSSLFTQLMRSLQEFFASKPGAFPGSSSLIGLLLEPSRVYPESIFDQLLFIRDRWSDLLSSDLALSLLVCCDQLKEESNRTSPDSGIFESPLGHYFDEQFSTLDPVGYSLDRDWMPQVAMQAKNVYVWLDQLSREYQKPITSLDQIPEEELLKHARRGINALWLIGLWERSPASQKIKQACGNLEAVSSAYSLFDYSIAESLGGENAFQHLSEAASRFNIKLAADMVPNHMGIDSRWISDHPEWFLSLDHPPFSGYTFNGIDLSSDPAINIFLEDHYYDKSDAAVVFKRFDKRTGETRFVYHGNDGTAMPWNDTAQLNYLNPDVREAVIQTVLDVARKFSIIRFDAAMTLTKKHFQRLWFPQPGSGGAIPTRSEFGLSKKQFDALMPKEFWREVVDRAAEEVPDTLLLAEAFWMMEGFFVRSLGMHRVYNSAFMHMLRDEDNKKYRKLIIDTLEFDPQILKRYVNFMNNPDEETALSQFGSGGKYFGTCVLMSTLPGLPMFGHGQIEGFAEKYGMEYKKAYYDEVPDPSFVERHQREIFPLLHRRRLFSEVDHFVLYDLISQDGLVNDDVIVYSNRSDQEQALIVFHNKWGDARGWISRSVSINGHSVDLLSGLGISAADDNYLIFKDMITGFEYIRSLQELSSHGLFLELGAFDYHVFSDFRVESDPDGSAAKLEKSLNGSGVLDIDKKRSEIKYSPLIDPISSLLEIWENENLVSTELEKDQIPVAQSHAFQLSTAPGQTFFTLIAEQYPELGIDPEAALAAFQHRISGIISLFSGPLSYKFLSELSLFLCWSFLADLPSHFSKTDLEALLSALSQKVALSLHLSDFERDSFFQKSSLLVLLAPEISRSPHDPIHLADLWFTNPHSRQFVNVHDFEGHTYFQKESMEALISLSHAIVLISSYIKNAPRYSLPPEKEIELTHAHSIALDALHESKYRVNDFKKLITRKSNEE